jgi:hypothetical protein
LHIGLVSLHLRKHTPVLMRVHMHVCVHTLKYIRLMLFHDDNGFVNASLCYGVHTLSGLFFRMFLTVGVFVILVLFM